MSQPPESESPTALQVANYPLECRERFLALSRSCQTASSGRLRHFIYPQVDVVLDDYLLWASIYDA